MAGSISLSLTQQLDQFGVPLSGAHLYFIQAGTVSTPQNAFQDSALTLPWPNPVILSASGRIPQLFFADGSIKIRLTDVNGVEILVADGILVVGASSGGGGGSPVDATTVLATGDIKIRYGTGVLSGFVRLNARTIGSATSGASERANADTQSLFEYLWNADPNLTVSTGRGGSSAADWAANKTITLPDFRGRVIAGLDDMGNSAAGRRTATYTGVVATVLGSVSTGLESHTMTAGESAVLAYTTAIATNAKQRDPASIAGVNSGTGSINQTWIGGPVSNDLPTQATYTTTTNAGGNPHSIVDPTIFITTYVKL